MVYLETLYRAKRLDCGLGMNSQLEIFAHNVRIHMTLQKLSAAVLAERAGIAEKTLNNILNSRHATQLDVLAKIARTLNVEFWQLWIPGAPLASDHAKIFRHLLDIAGKLSPDALKMLTRYAELELNSSNSD